MPRTLTAVVIPPLPSTPGDDIVETLHGERVADPYRWLEDDASPRVRDWTEAQNARTRAVLDALPQRAVLARRLRELLSIGLVSTARPGAGRTFHTRREGEQKQAVLYVRDKIDSHDRALVDPNAIDASGLVTLDWYYPSHDGRYVAYGVSRGGDELSTLRVIETATGRDLDERIPHTQRSTVAWVYDGFYYTVHPAPGSVPPGDESYYRRVRYHRLGDDPRKDVLVFGEGRPKEDILLVATSPNGRWVLFTAMKGWARTDLYVMDREHPGRGLTVAMEGQDAIAEGAPYDDGRLWLRTNLDAPNYRIVTVSCESPGASGWRTVIPESEDVIQGFERTRDRLARRDRDLDVPRAPHGREAERRRADAAHRVRRVQRLPDAGLPRRRGGLGGERRTLRAAEPARGRRVRRALAPRGHAREQAERVRRLPRRGGDARVAWLDQARSSRHRRRIERRAAGGRGADAVPRAFRRGVLCGAAARHAPLPELPDRAVLDRGGWLGGGPKSDRGATQILAVPQRAPGSPLPAGPLHHGRGR